MNDDVAAEPVWIEPPPPQGGSTLFRVVLVVGLCLVVIAASALGFWLLPRPVNDQEMYNRLSSILEEHRALRSRGATDAEWDAFAERAQAESREIAQKLSSVAGAQRPVSQQLLWATHDYQMPMIADARETPSRNEEKFTEHLENARRMLHGERN
jgi:hypothetical protein